MTWLNFIFSELTVIITIIHTLEALVVLLIGIKFLKIRSLYKEAYSHNSLAATSTPDSVQQTKHSRTVAAPGKASKPKSFLKTLPEPEVLFSVENESLSSNEATKPIAKKDLLNDYIDDFFFDAPLTEKPVNKDAIIHSHVKDSSNDDEFITIQEENAQVVRAMESLKKEIGLTV